jgi:outer membrane lipoprotein-sorting protein
VKFQPARLRLLLVLAVVGWGCAGTTPAIRDHPLSAPELLSHVRQRADAIRTMEGDGLITVESPEGSLNTSFELRLKKPDSLRLDLRGPFGLRGGTLLLDRSRFLYYNAMNNTVVTGSPDSGTLRKIVRLPIEFDDALRVFSGDFPPSLTADSLQRITEHDGRALLEYRTPTGSRSYEIDEESFVITGYRVSDLQGNETVTATSSRIRLVDTLRMPKLLRILFPQGRRSLTIAYDDIRINGQTVCFFEPPSRAEHLRP